MAEITRDLGPVTAYAYAVSKGYTGTQAEFAQAQASLAQNTADARAAADAIDGMTVTATTLDPNESATATVTDVDGHKSIEFGIPRGNTVATDIIAPDYADLTYPVKAGQPCIYNDACYVAKQDISSSESWTAAHWQEMTISEQMDALVKVSETQPTDPANTLWIVDDDVNEYTVPTIEEHNELKSAINQIGTYGISYNPTIGGFINMGGGVGSTVSLTPTTKASWGYAIVDVVPGERFIITTTGGNNSRAYGVVDSSNELLVVSNADVTLTDFNLTIPNNGAKLIINVYAPSPYSIVNSRIIDKNYIDARTNNKISMTWTDGAFLLSNGSLNNNASWSYSNFIELSAPLYIHLRCQFYDLAVSLIYNENKEIITVLSQSSESGYVFDQNLTLPATAKYIRLSCQTSKKSEAVLEFNYEKSILNIASSMNVYNDSTNPIEVVNPNDGGYMKIFNTFSVFGDSLSCGTFDTKVGGVISNTSKPWYSWGKYIERASGITVTLKAFAGATTKTWLSTFASSIDADKTRGYIIALGFNDMGSQDFPLGTSEDIDENDYTQNADSFYGNYAGIIQRIYEAQPDAKIFCMTMAKDTTAPSTALTNYCQAIRDVAEMFDCYVLDLYNNGYNYYEKAWFRNNYFRGHMLANGYIWTSWMVMQYISSIIEQNWSDFKNVQFIGSSGEGYED